MTTVSIVRLDESDPAALFVHYEGQYEPQDVHLELDTRDGEFTVDYNGEIGNSIPASVYHHQVLRFGLNNIPTTGAANALLTELAPLAQAVLDGYENDWDGRNNIGRPTTDAAHAAIEKIAAHCAEYWNPDGAVEEYDAGAWFAEGLAELGITAETTDADLEAIAEDQQRQAANASGVGYTVLTGTLEYLTSHRDSLRADA